MTSGYRLDDIWESFGRHLGMMRATPADQGVRWTTSGNKLDDIWESIGRHLENHVEDIWQSIGRHLGGIPINVNRNMGSKAVGSTAKHANLSMAECGNKWTFAHVTPLTQIKNGHGMHACRCLFLGHGTVSVGRAIAATQMSSTWLPDVRLLTYTICLYIPACLFACLSVCLSVFLSVCLSVTSWMHLTHSRS